MLDETSAKTAAKWENKSDQSLVRGLVVSKEVLKEIPSGRALDLQLACPTGKQKGPWMERTLESVLEPVLGSLWVSWKIPWEIMWEWQWEIASGLLLG
eukprot:gene7642-5494_t